MSFPLISRTFPLILASSSPRRKRLLKQLGLPFRARSSRIDEEKETGKPFQIARRLAEAKARAGFLRAKAHWVLGADTMVVLGGEVLGKPSDDREAASMLRILSGRQHKVITGFCLLHPLGEPSHREEVTTTVSMKKLTRGEIAAYVATGEPFGKAGGYAIQGVGGFMVESISGSYTNVVGLPVCAVVNALLLSRALRGFPVRP